jgi:hypothetical protein
MKNRRPDDDRRYQVAESTAREILEMFAALPPGTQRRLVNDLRANVRRARFVKIAGGKKNAKADSV